MECKGIIEKVTSKEGKTHPKYGKSYRVAFKIGEDWYSAFTKRDADAIGLAEGKLVSFTWSQDGDFKQFDPKSLSISTTQGTPADSPPKTGTSKDSGLIGIRVGHAVSCASTLLSQVTNPTQEDVYRWAKRILLISERLVSEYATILATSGVSKGVSEAQTPSATPARKEATAKAAPPPEPEVIEEDWDDEVPFE